MVRAALLCSLLVGVSVAGHGAEIHKCATPTGVSYQGLPCDGPEMPTSIVVASAAQAPTSGGGRAALGAGVSAAQAPPATSARTA